MRCWCLQNEAVVGDSRRDNAVGVASLGRLPAAARRVFENSLLRFWVEVLSFD
jgi:hypothetical protein